jgi:3-hydroxyacyl-[acyl-carrier-protein] dehydratase
MEVNVLRHRGDVFKFKGVARVDGRVTAEAEFTAMVVGNG